MYFYRYIIINILWGMTPRFSPRQHIIFIVWKQLVLTGQGRVNPLNAELNPICHLLILLGDLTFMGTCIISISNKMQWCNDAEHRIQSDVAHSATGRCLLKPIPFRSYVEPRPTVWFSCSAPILEEVRRGFCCVCSPAVGACPTLFLM
jgi:hypothetical protein